MIQNKVACLGLLVGAMVVFGPNMARADELQDIKSSGVLVVGVKADYPPFGYLSPTGASIGIEPDLARNLAQRLGVKVQFVPVVAANRIQFLQQGKINLLIATMNDTPEREKIVDIIHPNYYASGYNVMVPKTVKLTSWDALKGMPVCAIQGSFYNKDVGEKYGAELVAFTGVAEALTALQQGRCNAFLYDDTAIAGKLTDPTWKAYDMPLPTLGAVPWGMAVKNGEPAFAAFVSKASEDWEKTGYILSLETKYGIPHSAYAVQQHDKYKS
ncbi:transporter substrate-binding domain-containing protein [Acidocella sp.]|jgi:polar amino acid transport system substrate-binding protein|uniref:transporter substrate-binding domain-containing protein n=1 Tax=Acidocella sp. TaxID=50710 RepID=UPI002F3E930B